MHKTEKKNEEKKSIMSIVKENIEEENKEKKDLSDNNINNNINNINSNIKTNSNNNNGKIDSKKEESQEDPLISQMNNLRLSSLQGRITEEEINNSAKIILEEIKGNLLDGEKIEINAGGMVGGRGKYDGFAIFGQKNPKAEDNNSKNNFKPDFELNYGEYLPYPYIFSIYYKKEEKSYYIRAFSGKGSDNKILFIKLKNDKKFILKQKELISAGDNIFQVTPISNNFLEIIHLEKKRSHNNNPNEIKETTAPKRPKELDADVIRFKNREEELLLQEEKNK